MVQPQEQHLLVVQVVQAEVLAQGQVTVAVVQEHLARVTQAAWVRMPQALALIPLGVLEAVVEQVPQALMVQAMVVQVVLEPLHRILVIQLLMLGVVVALVFKLQELQEAQAVVVLVVMVMVLVAMQL
jgi:hypothetical protein